MDNLRLVNQFLGDLIVGVNDENNAEDVNTLANCTVLEGIDIYSTMIVEMADAIKKDPSIREMKMLDYLRRMINELKS